MKGIYSILQYRRRTALPHELKAAGEVRREPNLAKSSCSALQEAWVAPSPGEGTQDSSNSQEMSDSVGFSSPGGCVGMPICLYISVSAFACMNACMCTVVWLSRVKRGVCVQTGM